ncbi:glycosyltransferase [Bacteroides pyogenes]|uniref:glycosyltransferase n=1 Tax=Bacteroides pyogenes TaxID=310300 RepID=UPI001BABA89E|nr:glycosyltransferase [Bacteroides pyogenes]MBR8724381.1 UDP-Gal:alpha-D-GlcNAc-diphosphoundecaprenol beta-1,3-galactosyltransferase [Bacteroides pyogenes]MBR8737770.1 UDP-Gal:alpha-D-GlcNAc-diphosphoundecaprenol beta-1,3-galactosyltransferase [Bacteroides pyogenes]MBR8753457.1 UDP-Gal:alpha-D-GlcNAc-diphosphoundecaprenol beta-1,3-galactosyltransferase [Bacteroides pyogenes]MBR8794869.1 UDP-Gal:alpha-D-GlcNAc-diphosphoundecaprenol beta-1,3-galactosyltransferase [Bacteroides pyogenes]MBR880839
MNTLPRFSVCMSVYKNDSTTYLKDAVMSIYNQTYRPDEIILVIDGPVPQAMHDIIDIIKEKTGIMKVISLEKNMGHAMARQTGLEAAKNDLCAVMDADDLSVPARFEKQLKAFEEHPEVSVVGGLINEFIHTTDNVVGTRIVPEYDADIKNYLKSRCPMNLVTVMLKKSDVMKVGGYQDWYCEEDYYLWIRLALSGYKFYNIQENLVDVRVGEEMYQRRGGKKYFQSEARLQKYMLDYKLITWPKYAYNVSVRWAVQVAMPNWLRGWMFRTFARK